VGYVNVFNPLDAGFSASPIEGVVNRTVFSFTNETIGGNPLYTYAWQFGDGGNSASQNPTHIHYE
jgi:PKD repeat protein